MPAVYFIYNILQTGAHYKLPHNCVAYYRHCEMCVCVQFLRTCIPELSLVCNSFICVVGSKIMENLTFETNYVSIHMYGNYLRNGTSGKFWLKRRTRYLRFLVRSTYTETLICVCDVSEIAAAVLTVGKQYKSVPKSERYCII